MVQQNIQYYYINTVDGHHLLDQRISPVDYKLSHFCHSLDLHFKSTGSERSTGEQRKVTGVHDEARVQVQVILIEVVEFFGVGSFTQSLDVHKITVDV